MTTMRTDPVLDELTGIIVSRFAPERVVLIGSRARGDHHNESDYDIIVVLDPATEQGNPRVSIRAALSSTTTNVDVIVYTPAEFEERRHDVGALAYAGEVEGRVLYDRTPTRWPKQVSEIPPGRPKSLESWLERAENDFASMRALSVIMTLTDTICFHAHQSAEKFLRCVLIVHRLRPPRSHELPGLLRACTAALSDDRDVVTACTFLESVWPMSRYPDDGMPTRAQAQQAIAAASVVRDAARREIDGNGLPLTSA